MASGLAHGHPSRSVAPGFIETPMTDAMTEAQREELMGRIPAARLGSGLDVAAAVVALSGALPEKPPCHTISPL